VKPSKPSLSFERAVEYLLVVLAVMLLIIALRTISQM
jgi:hypothetical protein